MEDLGTRMGYLKGLVEGLGMADDTKEGKVIHQIIAVLDDIVDSVNTLKDDYDELFSYVEAIDEDLTDLEDDSYEGDDDDDDDDDFDDDDDDFDDDYEVSFTVECPECRQEVPIDDDILENEESLEVLCPNCGRVVFINDEEWEEELEEINDEEGNHSPEA
ncbi:MAG: CD1247 N-terminal domain-containing protein [Dethiobacteria bacterium]|jgi:DNA-directed RNA polymerase subunit delta